MSDNIDQLKAKIQQMEIGSKLKAFSLSSSGFLSRKLLVTLAILVALFWLGSSNVGSIILWAGLLGITYLVTQVVHDVATTICEARIKCALIEALAKDGQFSPEDAAAVDKKSE